MILATLGALRQADLGHIGDIASIALGAVIALAAPAFRQEIRGLIQRATRGRAPRSVAVIPEDPPPGPADSDSPGGPPTVPEAESTEVSTEPFLEPLPTSTGPEGTTSDRATRGGDGLAGSGARPPALRSRGEATIGGTRARLIVADRVAGLTTGLVLGDYRLEERLGRGGWGDVYRARHLWLDREVALKVIAPVRLASEPATARFSREMRAVGKLDHPHLVRATDARRVGPWHVLVMELLDGIDLEGLIRRVGPLAVADACEVARQAAEGLQHAHERGVVHRDVKPSNLMLTRGGTVKLLDLGLARLQGAGDGLTAIPLAMGTPDYMAPEQALDARRVTPRADLYSLGCLLYHLLAGRPPFREAPTPLDKMLSHRHTPAPPIGRWRPDLPEGLVGVLDHLLAKDPAERPGSARAVAEGMRPWCSGADLSGLLDRALRRDPAAAAPREMVLVGPVGRRGDGSVASEAGQVVSSRPPELPPPVPARGSIKPGPSALWSPSAGRRCGSARSIWADTSPARPLPRVGSCGRAGRGSDRVRRGDAGSGSASAPTPPSTRAAIGNETEVRALIPVGERPAGPGHPAGARAAVRPAAAGGPATGAET